MASRRWRWAGTPEAPSTSQVWSVLFPTSALWIGRATTACSTFQPQEGSLRGTLSMLSMNLAGRRARTGVKLPGALSLAVSPQPLWGRPRPPVHGVGAGPLTLPGVAARGSNTRQTIIIFYYSWKFSAQSLPCRAPPELPSSLALGGGMRAQAEGEG